MSRGNILSIRGLYRYNDKLFDKMVFPSGFSDQDKETTILNIIAECAELECLYPDWNFMHSMIEIWSRLENPIWSRIYNASLLEYNPIENYNRTELETVKDEHSDTHSGDDVTSNSGNDVNKASGTDTTGSTETHSGTDSNTNSNTAYDANTLYVHDKSDLLHGESISTTGSVTHGETNTFTHGKKETVTHGEKIDYSGEITKENHTSGNIGVTTSQQMLEQEINIAPALNVMKLMVQSFKERFCLLVY